MKTIVLGVFKRIQTYIERDNVFTHINDDLGNSSDSDKSDEEKIGAC